MYIKVMTMQQQWSGVMQSDIKRWLDNFTGITLEEQRLVYKLLVNIIYFSETDMISVLKDGLYNKLFYRVILEAQIKSNFELTPDDLKKLITDEMETTYFIPLLDRNAPHESGNYILRLLVQHGIVKAQNSKFLSDLNVETRMFSRIVIVDDCVGSGDQIRGYWHKAKVDVEGENVMSLNQYCKNQNVKVFYLVPFGYSDSIKRLQEVVEGLEVICVRELSEEQRVFNYNSYVWDGIEERQKAFYFFEKYTRKRGIELRGYRDLDFAFIMHKTIPDWSLPLFWKESDKWKSLVRRKNSDV